MLTPFSLLQILASVYILDINAKEGLIKTFPDWWFSKNTELKFAEGSWDGWRKNREVACFSNWCFHDFTVTPTRSLAVFYPSKQPGNQQKFIRVVTRTSGPSKQNHKKNPKLYKVFQKERLETKILSARLVNEKGQRPNFKWNRLFSKMCVTRLLKRPTLAVCEFPNLCCHEAMSASCLRKTLVKVYLLGMCSPEKWETPL